MGGRDAGMRHPDEGGAENAEPGKNRGIYCMCFWVCWVEGSLMGLGYNNGVLLWRSTERSWFGGPQIGAISAMPGRPRSARRQ